MSSSDGPEPFTVIQAGTEAPESFERSYYKVSPQSGDCTAAKGMFAGTESMSKACEYVIGNKFDQLMDRTWQRI